MGWSVCSETGGQFTLESGGQFDRFFQAAARNWMLNTPKFSVNLPNPQAQKANPQPRAYNLNATIDKNYAEPL